MENEEGKCEMEHESEDRGHDFRSKIEQIPEDEEGLTEAFKAKLYLNMPEEMNLCQLKKNQEIDEIEKNNDLQKEATLSKYKFKNFIKSSLNENIFKTPHSKPFSEPLIKNDDNKIEDLTKKNAVVISHAIKIYCKDFAFQETNNDKKLGNVLSQVFKNLSNQKENNKNSSTLEGLLSSIPGTEFQQAQFIVCYGILNKNLRDEIFCQLCCHVTNNPSEESLVRAWHLHLLCSGCFIPTKKFLKYYLAFLNDVSDEKFLEKTKVIKSLVLRTNSFGIRYHPPNYLEFQAGLNMKKIILPVKLADDRTIEVAIDSATTASEVCKQISDEIELSDQFGFAVYIAFEGKISSLGNGLDHVMDAIGECEQYLLFPCKETHWKLFFAKELFTPWHNAELDGVSTDLIYHQVVKSVATGDFKFKSNEDLARFLARRLVIEEGHNLNVERLKVILKNYLPKVLKHEPQSEQKWVEKIMSAFKNMNFNSTDKKRNEIKWSIVEGAQRKWPLQFSAFFEAEKISENPKIGKNEVVVAISCRGVFLLAEPYKLLSGLHYYEIIEVNYEKGSKTTNPSFNMMTIRGSKWVFKSPNAFIVTKILSTFLDGLRRRSRWAIAINEFILRDHTKVNTDDFHLIQGDLVQLMDESAQNLPETWMIGRCMRTGKVGQFPFDCVYIFPTSEKPPQRFLELFSKMSKEDYTTLPRKRATVLLSKGTFNKKKQSII